jgi:hypothetical protein
MKYFPQDKRQWKRQKITTCFILPLKQRAFKIARPQTTKITEGGSATGAHIP